MPVPQQKIIKIAAFLLTHAVYIIHDRFLLISSFLGIHLYKGGATNEVINTLCHLGICSRSGTVRGDIKNVAKLLAR